MSTTIASNFIQTNSVELINTTTSDLVIGSTISATNSVRIGKSSAGGVPVTFPSYVTTDRINPVSSTGRMLIGTVNGADQLLPFLPSITIGRVGQTVRIGGGTTTGGKLQVNDIDTINSDDQLVLGNLNAGSVKLCNNLIVNSGFMTASSITLYNDGTNSIITIRDDPYPLYIAPSTTIDPDTVCSGLNLGNTDIPVQIEGTTINIGNGGATPSTTILKGLLSVSSSTGTAGQVLTSGGSTGSLAWATPSPSVRSGKISTPTYSATTPTLYSFSPAFTGTIPTVVLTVDNGSSASATIIIAGLASVTLGGFYYVLSSAVPAGGTLNWYATQ